MLAYSDYKVLYKSLIKKRKKFKKNLEVSILSSFTTQVLDEILFVKCFQLGIHAKIYQAPYNQYNQEIVNSNSNLYQFGPDLVILIIDPISFLGDYLLNPYQLTHSKRKKFIKSKFNELKELISKLKSSVKNKIVIHNFDIPRYSPFGILENKQQFGFHDSIRYLNNNLQSMSMNDPNLLALDYDADLLRFPAI